MKPRLKALLGICISLMLIASCKLSFSPWQTDLPQEQSGLTQKNLDWLKSRPQPKSGRFKIAILGDPQGTPGDFKQVVAHINKHKDLEFMLVLGDLTDYGLKHEYEWAYDALKTSSIPYFTSVGNHDAISNGKDLYRRMFGDYDYVFHHGGIKFVIWNNNKHEFGHSNFDWLKKQLGPNTVVASHIPPEVDVHTGDEVDHWLGLNSRANIITSMHGHRGTTDAFYWHKDGIPYYVVAKVDGGHYAIVTFDGGRQVNYESCKGDTCTPVGNGGQ